jgi:hypothetical protein
MPSCTESLGTALAAGLLCAALPFVAMAADERRCEFEVPAPHAAYPRFGDPDADCRGLWRPSRFGGLSRSTQWALGDATRLHAGLGRTLGDRTALSHMQRASTTWALAIEHRGPQRLNMVAEVFGDSRQSGVWVQAGVRWAVVPSKVHFDARLNVQPLPGQPHAFTLGASIAF